MMGAGNYQQYQSDTTAGIMPNLRGPPEVNQNLLQIHHNQI